MYRETVKRNKQPTQNVPVPRFFEYRKVKTPIFQRVIDSELLTRVCSKNKLHAFGRCLAIKSKENKFKKTASFLAFNDRDSLASHG